MDYINYYHIDVTRLNAAIINAHNILASYGLQIVDTPSIEVMDEPVQNSTTVHGSWTEAYGTGLTFKCLSSERINNVTTIRTTRHIDFKLDHIDIDDDELTSTSIVKLNFILNELTINKPIKF
jgi:hypothetical protein